MDDNKKRRSSILKVKARKPFGDLCNDDETEDTVTRARRVSFAASNQVKKFTALGEQHTIWDSTYEESVEGSDHSPSSLQLQSTQSCTINKENIKISENLDVTTIPNITLEMAHSNQRQFKEHEIKTVEITKVVDKENKNVRIKTTEHQTIITDKTVEFTQMNRTNYVGDDMEMSRMDSKQVLPENVYQPSTVCDSFMELTTMIPGLIVTHQVQDMSLDDTLDPGIEFTMPVQGNIQEKLKDESFTMDFTTPLPVRMNIIQGTGETSEKTENNYEMKFTRPIPLNIIQETDVKEKIYSPIDMELTKPVNFTINQINDMEFTEVVGALNDYEMERTKAVGGNIMGPADVENCELDFTEAVGGNIHSRENKLLNEGDDKVLCESLVKNVQSVSEGNSIFESETLKSFKHTETKNKIVEQDKENVLSNTENLNMSLEKSLFVSDCAESSKSNSKLILSTCNKSKIESKIENALIKESVKEIVKHDSAVTSKMSANIDIPSSKFKFETAEVSNYLSEKDLIITESTESSKSDQTPFKSEDKIKIKKKMIKSEVVSHENVSTTSKNTTNTNTANIKGNVSSNLPCERANIFNNHLDKTSFNPGDKTRMKTEMIKSEVVSCENVPTTSKNTTNTNTANIKENVSSNLPCERANIFNNHLDKTSFNPGDKTIMKTEMIKSEVVSCENVPTTSKNTTNTNTANIKENVSSNLPCERANIFNNHLDKTSFNPRDKTIMKTEMIKSEVVSCENVPATSKNTTNTNTANIKENVSSNLPCERANIFNNHLDKTSFNPGDKTIMKTQMIKSEVVSCENVPTTSKNTTNTNTANIKENVSSNLPCERANIFNNHLDKTSFNPRDKAIIKTEMIKSEVVSSENVPTTSKNTTDTNTANIKENVCPNLASTTDLSIISKTITDINIANIKDDVSSNLVCKTAQNLFDKSPAVLQDIKISTSQLLPTCNKSKIETETTAAASTNLLEMSKSSIIILNNTDMTMDNNPEHHVTPSQTCLKDSANLSKTNMDLTDNSLTAKQSINKNLKAVECKAQTHKERKTIDAKSLITPECKKHRFRPSKHASETPLTPVVSAKKKRETPQLPRKPKLFGENNKSLQAIEERPAENEQSLHYLSHCTINSANSSNYDDTNHLINYNISGGKSRSNCKSDFSKIVLGENMSFPDLVNMPLGVNSPSFHVSLNDTTNKSRADITTELGNSHSENSHLENMLDNTRPPDFLIDMSASISDSVIVEEPKTMLDRILSESLSLLNEKKEDVLKIDLDQSKRIQDKFCWLFRKLSENIKREIEECRNSLSSSDTTFDDCSTGESTYEGSFTKNLIKEDVAQKSILDKINDLFKRNGKQSKWSLLSSEETTHTFATLYKTIIFTVHLNAEIVKDIKLENQLSKTVVRPDALYTHQIFMEKLSLKNIQKSLGEKFDIISLLDYVQLTMLNITDLRKELQYLFDTYGAILEDDFKLRFSIIRIERMFVWNFAINMRELEPVNEKTVEYFAKIGTPRNELIQVCSAGCPNGVPFARQFIQNLYAYVDKKNHK